VESTLRTITERSQFTPNGLANWDRDYGEFYIEETGIIADALEEALVQDYDGVIRIAPAIPPAWDFDGSVSVRGRTKVDVEVRNGEVVLAVIEAGSTAPIRVRNPWPGQAVDVVSGTLKKVISADSAQELQFHAIAGNHYLIEKHEAPAAATPFAELSGIPAHVAKKLGSVQIGLFKDESGQAK
jgi:hypothetical protein